MTAPSRLARWVMRQWQIRGWFAGLMLPLSWVTAAVVARKQAALRSHRGKPHHPGVPVVIVGNILVGGTGKTPVVIAITQYLQSRGWRPGILSRGYGVASGSEPRVGDRDLDPGTFGDEPVLINRQTGAPIAVHPRRVQAATALLQAFPDVDVLVCDDGLQHLALARDVEIVVQDQRGIGNGRLLPAGPLREPATRLQHVTAIVTNRRNLPSGASPQPDRALPKADWASPRADHTSPQADHASPRPDHASPLADRASRPQDESIGDARMPPLPFHVDMHVVPGDSLALSGAARRSLAHWADQSRQVRICAAAGIGQPDAFFGMLQQAGIHLSQQISLPDHFDYQVSPFEDVDADIILVTSKDAVKCRRLGDARIWEVPIAATFDHPDFPGCILDPLKAMYRPEKAPGSGNLL